MKLKPDLFVTYFDQLIFLQDTMYTLPILFYWVKNVKSKNINYILLMKREKYPNHWLQRYMATCDPGIKQTCNFDWP